MGISPTPLFSKESNFLVSAWPPVLLREPQQRTDLGEGKRPCHMSHTAMRRERERRQCSALLPASCEMCRRVCTQISAQTNKPNLAKNNRKGNRCFQLKCQRLPRSRVLTWCGCLGPRTAGRDHIRKSVCIVPRPSCHVRHWPDLAISMLAVSRVWYADAGKDQKAARQ